MLFSAVFEMIFRRQHWDDFGLNVNGQKLSHLRFAVDLILFFKFPKTLEKMLQQLSEQSANAGLTTNVTKTKVITNYPHKDASIFNNQYVEYVNEYIY